MSNDALDRSATDDASYESVQQSSEFKNLRGKFRRYVFTLTALFLVWYFLYVLMCSFAPEFMAHKLGGNITNGLVFGLLQFVSTFTITIAYVRWMDRNFDPAADSMREHMEAGDV